MWFVVGLWVAAAGCWPGAFKIGDGFSRPRSAPCSDPVEDYDGFRDSDGCADPDNDEDGVADVDDLCPNESGDLSSPASRGCPARASR